MKATSGISMSSISRPTLRSGNLGTQVGFKSRSLLRRHFSFFNFWFPRGNYENLKYAMSKKKNFDGNQDLETNCF